MQICSEINILDILREILTLVIALCSAAEVNIRSNCIVFIICTTALLSTVRVGKKTNLGERFQTKLAFQVDIYD